MKIHRLTHGLIYISSAKHRTASLSLHRFRSILIRAELKPSGTMFRFQSSWDSRWCISNRLLKMCPPVEKINFGRVQDSTIIYLFARFSVTSFCSASIARWIRQHPNNRHLWIFSQRSCNRTRRRWELGTHFGSRHRSPINWTKCFVQHQAAIKSTQIASRISFRQFGRWTISWKRCKNAGCSLKHKTIICLFSRFA